MSQPDLSFGFPTRARVVRPSLSSLYVTVLGVAVLGSMAWQTVSDVVGPAVDDRLAPALALVFSAVPAGAVLVAARRAGPAGMARGALSWCLGSATVTTMMLRRALLGRAVVAAAAGLVIGLGAALLQGATWPWVAGAAVGGTVLGAGLAAVAAADQVRGRRASVRAGSAVVLLGAIAWYASAFDLVTVPPALLPAAGGGVLLVVLVLVAASAREVRRAVLDGRYDVRELARANEVTEAVRAGLAMLAASPLQATPRRRRPLRMPRGGRGRPAWIALVDLRRILARPGPLLVMAALVPLPGSAARAGHRGLAGVVLVLLGYAALTRLALWYRDWETSASLRAWLPFDDRAGVLALLAAPMLLLLVLTAVAGGIAGLPPGWVWSTVVGALLGLRRKIAGDRVPGELWVTTEMGAIPLNQAQRAVAGWDVALVVGLLSLLLW